MVESASPWLRRPRPAPDALASLVCFPHAGGSALQYGPFARALSPAVDVLAVQYPGRYERRGEPAIDDVHVLADRIKPELSTWTGRPLLLFGHSLGALVAFEVALRMEREGAEILGLIASGRRAPSCSRNESMHESDDRALIANLESLGGTDARLLSDPFVLEMLLPYLRSDYKAAETYEHRSGDLLGCPIFALTGDADPCVTAEEARAWSAHTTGTFHLTVFPGGHFFVNDYMLEVTEMIRTLLGSAAGAGSAPSGSTKR